MPINDRLDEIQERANIARQVLTSGTTGVPPNVAGVDVYETVDILAESATDVPRLVAALRAVLDRHKPCPDEGMGWREDHTYGGVGTVCNACGTPDEYGVPWPCPTVRAVQAALGEEASDE